MGVKYIKGLTYRCDIWTGSSFRILLKNGEDKQIVHTLGFNNYQMENETLKLLKNQKGITDVEDSDTEEEKYKTVQYNIEKWAGTKKLANESFTETKRVN